MQALGSLLAILVAGAIVFLQMHLSTCQTRKLKRLEDVDRIIALQNIVEEAAKVQVQLLNRLGTRTALDNATKDYRVMPEVLELEKALDRIERHLLPPKVLVDLYIVTLEFAKFRIVLENALKNSHSLNESTFQKFRSDMKETSDNMAGMPALLQYYIDCPRELYRKARSKEFWARHMASRNRDPDFD